MADQKISLATVMFNLQDAPAGDDHEFTVIMDPDNDRVVLRGAKIQLLPEALLFLAEAAKTRTVIIDRSGEKGRITIF